ncbi:MAG: DUF169 domain-containing protein [Eggerthellaceae bacterium]|nr:DUF169 domain-containing protein [Eggerthellaceae bacterium]MDO5118136.1 DUF169 domain-containing protein [Eggerthellaceae bacterium]
MDVQLIQMLHLELEPVGIFLGNTDAECDITASPEKRNCIVPLLLSAAHGKAISVDEESCNCPGGAVGCCFGDGFTRGNPNIHTMLSQGMGDAAPEKAPIHMKEGERFFCTEELALKWRTEMPYSDKGYPRVVFAPQSRWEGIGTPNLVFVFANADQISAMVALLGFHNGRALNTIAPFGAACHSIVYAVEQMEKDEPLAVMGLFDISQRSKAIADYLSLTMPYAMWEELACDLDKSCLTTHAWKAIEERL